MTEKLKLPPDIETRLSRLSVPVRAYVLAKAAFEVAEEANFAEQRAAIKAVTDDDPEPTTYDQIQGNVTKDKLSQRIDAWLAWNKRNKQRITEATVPIVARYPDNLKKLYRLAEQNMVDAAEEIFKKRFLDGFNAVAPVFQMYRENNLHADNREKFLKLCFNAPNAKL